MPSPLGENGNGDGFMRHMHASNGGAISYAELDGEKREDYQTTVWKPGFWGSNFPTLGLLSLFGVLASTVAGIVVLVVSNQLPLEKWGSEFTPAVSMAICSVVSNSLLTYALANGLVISFWRTALRGHTLAELNQNWLCGHSLKHAIMGGFRVGGRVTALACIVSLVSLLRGPLNQRASRVESNVAYNTSGTIPLAVAQRLTEGYTGIARDSRAPIMEISRLTPEFAQVMQEYSERSNISITIPDHACGDSCTTSVKGFGFKTECGTNEYVQYQAVNKGSFDLTVFSTSSDLYQIDPPEDNLFQKWWPNAGLQLNVTMIIPSLPDDVAPKNSIVSRFRTHICNVTGATVEYKAQLSSQSISLSPNGSDDRVLEDLVLQGPGTFGHDSTIGGFNFAASDLFTSEAVYHFAGALSDFSFRGSLANQQLQNISQSNITFGDPMNYMVNAMREIAFRTAVLAGKDEDNRDVTNALQQVKYQGIATHSLYVSDWWYMTGAAVLSVVSVVVVGLTFYGWWELGHDVSLSPLDIARAFDSPLLKHDSPGLAGLQRVQYGKEIAVERDAASKEIGGQYADRETGRRRLVLGLTGTVKRPSAGEVIIR